MDSNTELTITLMSGIKEVQLNPEHSYKLKIKNNTGYLTEYDLEIKDNQLILTTDKLKDFTPDDYEVEVWDSYEDKDSIYPDEDYGTFKIDKNVSEVDGKTIPVITIEEFNKRIDETLKKVENIEQIKGEKGDPGERGADGRRGSILWQFKEAFSNGNYNMVLRYKLNTINGESVEVGDWILDINNKMCPVTSTIGVLIYVDKNSMMELPKGADGKSAYQIWLDLGNTGSEADFLNSLKGGGSGVRHAPTGYSLDTSTKPWTIWFDNGCGFQMPNWWNNKAFYSYGRDESRWNNKFDIYDHPRNIEKVSRGVITAEDMAQGKKVDSNYASYWNDSFVVLNPIRDRNDYDWSNVKFNDISDVNNQKWIARTLYELGIWSGETFESFGAVRKAGN